MIVNVSWFGCWTISAGSGSSSDSSTATGDAAVGDTGRGEDVGEGAVGDTDVGDAGIGDDGGGESESCLLVDRSRKSIGESYKLLLDKRSYALGRRNFDVGATQPRCWGDTTPMLGRRNFGWGDITWGDKAMGRHNLTPPHVIYIVVL